MNKATLPPRWFSTWRATPALQQDPADLGTCFGLDLSLGDSDDADRPDPTPAGRDAGWVQRWTNRRKPAA